ncbi:ABC transporter ATP-binding protein [Acholeplasma hippikon]|uniref:ABC-type multidrug/protein/lipid transport system ATPase component n=1 Tax=Acholeplasma hippikon TaxID=264636 RepID=A0A449BHW3_9MOLU|nr:ABC transporter ATP-binding protein [Acholeplasma hippikon]VEU82003.1 ABC-type multidrug/protein/lipid transport system ATPase component [Acholeplasma hippikon]
MILLKHFRKYYLKYAVPLLLGIGILILVDYVSLEIPRIIKVILNGVDLGEYTTIEQVVPYLVNLSLIVLTMTIGRFLWRYLLIGTGRRVETDVREAMFNHATTLSQDFYSKEKIGGLMTYFISDINVVKEMYGFGLLMVIDGLVLGGMVLVRMFSLQFEMTAIAFIPIALMGILMFFINKKMEKQSRIRQEAQEALSDFSQESFTGITVVKAYVKEMFHALTFRKKSQELYDKTMNHTRYSIIVNIGIDVMINLVILSILGFGSYLIAVGDLSGPELTEYISYFFSLLWPVFAISWFMNVNAQAQASAKRINNFLEAKVDVKSKEDALLDVQLDGSINVTNLSFKYEDGEDYILKNMSFEIKPGEMVGILGKTGSGKSTLVELLLRVYNTRENMIKFGEYDINDISIKALRKHIGYVPQDNFLFSDTIKNNIGFAFDEPMSEEKMIEVAQLSDLHENVLGFQDQYETMLGERGTTISGGQKQRVSIARALAKDPTFLILDDSVSAVDTKTEEKIISNLRKIRKGKTTLMIAHRISTVKKLDKILLIEEGQVAGFGTHKELLKTNALYQEMVKRQELEALVGEVE